LKIVEVRLQVADKQRNTQDEMRLLGYLYGKSFGSKITQAFRMKGCREGGGSEYRNRLWRANILSGSQ